LSAFDISKIGQPTDFSTSALEAEAGIAYAKATNDTIALHLDGTYMPPIFGVVPVWEKVFEVVSGVVPEEHFFSVVHGEQDMIFHKPLKSGIELKSRATGQSVSLKDSGTTLVVKSESFDNETDELVLEQYFTMFFRGVNGENSVGEPHDMGIDLDLYKTEIERSEESENFVAKVQVHFDDDQTFRYAQASGDFMPIHIDEEFAKSVGLPGMIIHGLCTMAAASWAAIQELCESDPTKLTRIAVRFSKPLRPGDDLVTRFYRDDSLENEGSCLTYFLSSNRVSDGEMILTKALVEVIK